MRFTAIVPTTRNFTASDLMREYAAETAGVTFTRGKYMTAYICKDGKAYAYDHLQILNSNADTIALTVYLTEKRS